MRFVEGFWDGVKLITLVVVLAYFCLDIMHHINERSAKSCPPEIIFEPLETTA